MSLPSHADAEGFRPPRMSAREYGVWVLPTRLKWGVSSVGRARRSQRRGRGFESPTLHQFPLVVSILPQGLVSHNRSLASSRARPANLGRRPANGDGTGTALVKNGRRPARPSAPITDELRRSRPCSPRSPRGRASRQAWPPCGERRRLRRGSARW